MDKAVMKMYVKGQPKPEFSRRINCPGCGKDCWMDAEACKLAGLYSSEYQPTIHCEECESKGDDLIGSTRNNRELPERNSENPQRRKRYLQLFVQAVRRMLLP
jgi:hypothetical protein